MIEITRALLARGRDSVARRIRRAGLFPAAALVLMVQPVVDRGVVVATSGVLGVLGGGVARAQMPTGDPAEEYGIRVARVKYGGGGDWYSDPSSLPNWLAEFEARTGIRTHKEEKVVALTDENLRAYPFLYMTGHGTIKLTPEELSALRSHLEAGGFLYADDNYGFDASFREMVRELFPEEQLTLVPNRHPIFKSFYDLPGLPKIHEHDGKPPQAFAVTIDGRMVLFYTYESDIGDGLEDPNVHNDTPEKRELAIRMAVNILMYAITQNALL